MRAIDLAQLVLYCVALTALAFPLGTWMARVIAGERTFLSPLVGPLERACLRAAGIDPAQDDGWVAYATKIVALNVAGLVVVYAIQRLQGWLPLNPSALGAVGADSSFNTAVSFATNTNWQGYAGEATMSRLTQMAALGVQNFLSAATGIAVLVALVRGFTRRNAQGVGNAFVDVTRITLHVLLPLSLVVALFLVTQGVVQTLAPDAVVQRVEPVTYTVPAALPDGSPRVDAAGHPVLETHTATTQTLALGPVASQEAIKQLGTNGGGYFNVNSAHPFENPTPLSNFAEMLAILLLPAALCFTFGRLVGDRRQGRALFAAMAVLFVGFLAVTCIAEQQGNPRVAALGVDVTASPVQSGGNMEGKETRFGIVNSALWATATTAASNGSVNSMHDSYTPLGGLAPMVLMQLGEVVFGGVGSGLYGMLIFAIVAVFIAGLMVGRTPEYLGKKIEAYEMKMAAVAVLAPYVVVLAGAALAVATSAGRAGVANPGAHGFSEILYALSSAGNNNGSAFAGLSANTPFYNTLLGVAMWVARFWVIVPVLAIAGSLAGKKQVATGAGTLPTHTPLFVALLVGTVLIMGALTFVPALALGPVAEHLALARGH
ncbi:MAG: potassium-transporting ATPase subunit KdpA [Proteobacteria bacterium]|nr:potassium-transporting ATPase subunit KdpA [Pseudomonadota bacterium]